MHNKVWIVDCSISKEEDNARAENSLWKRKVLMWIRRICKEEEKGRLFQKKKRYDDKGTEE